jgi:glycosyltransferase involved in cell wall biosynthesis
MNKVTAIIPTYNEEIHIQEAIESLLWADEIIVVDSFSTDKTQEIVKTFPQVKLFIHEYQNSAAQKNWIIPQAMHEWIFLLDADERPSKKLINEIQALLKQEHIPEDAFWIKRNNTFMGRKLVATWRGDGVIRLFRKTCRYEEKNVHAEIILQGNVGKLCGELDHDTYRGKGLEFHLKKGDRYSTWSAYDYKDRVDKVTLYHLALRPMAAFIKHYFLKAGFLDGRQGFVIAVLTSWNIFCRFLKVWRIKEGEKF